MRQTDNSRNPIILVMLAAAFLAAASVFLLLRQYSVEIDNARIQLVARGRTTLDALAAGIHAQSHRGFYRQRNLAAIFDELADTPGIHALQLRSPTGAVVASGGELHQVLELPPETAEWQPEQLIMTAAADFRRPGRAMGPGRRMWENGDRGRGWEERGRGMGRGLGGPPGRGFDVLDDELVDTPWEEGPHILTVVLDTGDMQVAIRSARLRLAGGAVIVLLAIGSGAWAFVSQLRQRRLMTDLLLAEEQAAESERLARLGAGLAHETKNPLGIVRGLAQSILETANADRGIRNMAQQIVDESDRTVGQVNAFLGFARPLEPELRPISLGPLLEHMKPLFDAEARGTDIQIQCDAHECAILADENMLRRAIMNLVINGIRAIEHDGTVTVRAEQADGSVRIVVEDTGCGIAPEDLGRITDPYFGRFEGGSGLGLSIVDQIARAHGWRLRFRSDPGSNTQVSIEGLAEVP